MLNPEKSLKCAQRVDYVIELLAKFGLGASAKVITQLQKEFGEMTVHNCQLYISLARRKIAEMYRKDKEWHRQDYLNTIDHMIHSCDNDSVRLQALREKRQLLALCDKVSASVVLITCKHPDQKDALNSTLIAKLLQEESK